MKLRWKYLLPAAVVLLAAVGAVRVGDLAGLVRNRSPGPAAESPVHTIAVARAAQVTREKTLVLTGSVEASEEASVSARVAGRVRRVLVEEGAEVAADQPLVLLEDEDYRHALATARAGLRKAEVNLEAARTNFERVRFLYQQAAVARKDFEDAETALRLAEAEVEAAAAQVAAAEESLRHTVLRAPIGGTVANRRVNPGQTVGPGHDLLWVLNLARVDVVVQVEQESVGLLRVGQEAAVTVEAYGGRRFPGVVALVSPAANPAARTFTVKVRVENPERLLKPGMFARVVIETGTEERVTVVPQAAVAGAQGEFHVFAVEETPEGFVVRRRRVELGQAFDRLVEVGSGLAPGERVAVTNVDKLKDGDRVNVAEERE